MNLRTLMCLGIGGVCWLGVTSSAFAEVEQATASAVASATEETAEVVEEAVAVVGEATEVVGEVTAEASAVAGDEAATCEVDMAEAMAKFAELTTPGEHHAKLDAFVGSWDITMSSWMMPGAPPQVSTGTSEIAWILDGRYLQEHFQGTAHMPGMEPQPYSGFGLRGYDNAKGEYTGLWADNMSTAAAHFTGQYDDETKTLTSVSQFDCPIQGPCSMRITTTVISPDEFLTTGYMTVEGQEETKSMEIVYKRRY